MAQVNDGIAAVENLKALMAFQAGDIAGANYYQSLIAPDQQEAARGYSWALDYCYDV